MNDDTQLPKPQATTTILNKITDLKFCEKTSLKIMYMNARSIKNKTDELYHLIKTINSDIHILNITETWITANEAKYFTFDGYDTHHSCRKNKNGGGSSIFIKKNNNIKSNTIFSFSDDKNSFISQNISLHNQQFNITNIYRAPGIIREDVDNFLSQLQNHIHNTKNQNSIITGDFNFNLIENNNNTTQKYRTSVELNNMYFCDDQTVTRNVSGTAIDHIITNIINKPIHLHYLNYDVLDHNIIFIEICNTHIENITNKYTVKYIDQTKIKEQLIERPILVNTTLPLDIVYDQFIDQFTKIIKKATKTKTYTKQSTSKPWYDEELARLYKIKNFWYYKKKRDPANENLNMEYKRARNIVTKIAKLKKQKYYEVGFEKAEGNNEKVWKHIKRIMYNGNEPSKENCITKMENPQIFIENLNTYTATIGTTLQSTFNEPNINFTRIQTDRRFNFHLTDKEDILQTIKQMKNSKATGSDEINTYTIKENAEFIAEPISNIINKSLLTGQFPEKMKTTKITPVYKNGNKNDVSNYRPIGILSNITKILEKTVNKQLMEYIDSAKIINEKQYGFRNKSNTSTALFDFVSMLQTSLDQKYKTSAMFIDLRKAFETVNRKILLRKLFNIGIHGTEHKWFSNYLQGRNQYTEVQNFKSKLHNINAGVPQGAHPSTTLFIIFVNDIADLQLSGKLFMYADDIAIIYSANSTQELEKMMNEDCEKLQKYMDTNQLTINDKKTQYMLFNENTNIQIKYKNKLISRTAEIKYLGMHIDETLKWKIHIEKTLSKIVGVAAVFWRISKYIPYHKKRQIFFALFSSRITYGIMIWYSAFKIHINQLQIIQNKAIRNLYNHPITVSNKHIHKQNNIQTLEENSNTIMALHIYNIIHNSIHTTSNIQQINNVHNYNTRAAINIYIEHTNTTQYGSRKATRQAAMAFNKLPLQIKMEENKKKFKQKAMGFFSQNN